MDRGLIFRLLLGVSLAFNVAVAFAIVRHHPPMHTMEDVPDETLRRLTCNLSSADAAKVRQAFDARREEFMRTRQQMHGDLVTVNSAMQATPFDQAALRRALDDVHRERTAFGALIEETILDSAMSISPEGRAKLLPVGRELGVDKPH